MPRMGGSMSLTGHEPMSLTEHVCDWGPWHPWCSQYRCLVQGCYKVMNSDEVARRINAAERLIQTIGFFASVIKSGEPWTDACETAYVDAREGK